MGTAVTVYALIHMLFYLRRLYDDFIASYGFAGSACLMVPRVVPFVLVLVVCWLRCLVNAVVDYACQSLQMNYQFLHKYLLFCTGPAPLHLVLYPLRITCFNLLLCQSWLVHSYIQDMLFLQYVFLLYLLLNLFYCDLLCPVE